MGYALDEVRRRAEHNAKVGPGSFVGSISLRGGGGAIGSGQKGLGVSACQSSVPELHAMGSGPASRVSCVGARPLQRRSVSNCRHHVMTDAVG